MSNEKTSNDYTNIERADFKEMEIGKLRQYASLLKIAVPKTAKKDDIIELIDQKLKGRSAPLLAEGTSSVPPGHAKIKVLEDPMPGSSNLPVYFNANGYEGTLPRGHEVIVPMRVVRTLNDAKVKRKKQTSRIDEHGREFTQDIEVEVPSYAFQVIEMNPGPEALTPFEQAKLRTHSPKQRFKKKFGYYPRAAQLRRAIENGLIELEEHEELEGEDVL